VFLECVFYKCVVFSCAISYSVLTFDESYKDLLTYLICLAFDWPTQMKIPRTATVIYLQLLTHLHSLWPSSDDPTHLQLSVVKCHVVMQLLLV